MKMMLTSDINSIINSSPLSSINNDYVPKVSHNHGCMELDCIYDQNMIMPLIFSYGKEPKDLTSNNSITDAGY